MPKTERIEIPVVNSDMTPKEPEVPENQTPEQKLRAQVLKEFQASSDFMRPKFDTYQRRMKVYSNQKKDPEAVGDPLLYTVFDTLKSIFYNDQMKVKFLPRGDGDDNQARDLSDAARYDAGQRQMNMPVLDHDIIWATMFYSHAVVKTMRWSREKMTMIPELYDMMTFYRDPEARSINGDSDQNGASRFYGAERRVTMRKLEEHGGYDLEKLRQQHKNPTDGVPDGGSQPGFATMTYDAQEARSEASGHDFAQFAGEGDNKTLTILEWFTWFDGKRVMVEMDLATRQIIREEELDDQKKWPAVDFEIDPMANQWDGVSVPDIMEDKQNARSAIINLALDNVRSSLYPTYIYDQGTFNKEDLKLGFNKYISSKKATGDITRAIQPLPRGDQVTSGVGFVLEFLDSSTQRATGATNLQQGQVSAAGRTAEEISTLTANADTRYSLKTTILGWGYAALWAEWYRHLKENWADGLEEKVVRVAVSSGYEFRNFTKNQLKAGEDPDIEIESAQVAELKRNNELQIEANTMQMLAAVPGANVRRAMRNYLRKANKEEAEIDQLMPYTPHELRARRHVEMINNDEMPPAPKVGEDHRVYLEYLVDAKAGPIKDTVIRAREAGMIQMIEQPQLYAGVLGQEQRDLAQQENADAPSFALPGNRPSNR